MGMGPPGTGDAPAGVYVHVPFCSVRCTYCDFPTVAGQDGRIPAYLAALEREIGSFQPSAPEDVDTVYLGGGTPSRLSPDEVARILSAVRGRFAVAPGAEVTLEGNPESLSEPAIEGFVEAGVNRISVGVQSLDDRVLRATGRAHDAAGAEAAVLRVRRHGGCQVNADLIAGLPGEDLSRWGETLDRVQGWDTDHVSVYLLETDKDTPLSRAVASGRAEVADDDRQADLYRLTAERLEAGGLALYEISNFARAGRRSRHNLKYWTDAPYAAFGLGAHGYLGGMRRANRKDLAGYLRALEAGEDPIVWSDPFEAGRRLGEALMLGLRLAEGVDLGRVGARYGIDAEARFGAEWREAEEAGLLERQGRRVWLTAEGRLRSNALFVAFV
jgi:oxygen-independent coproporphyrinogen-3 oxidase